MLSPKPPLDPPLAPPSQASSSASSSSARSRARPPKRPSRLSPKRPPPPASIPDPSSGILALLVTVAGSSSANGYPTSPDAPPDFLCPRLHAWSLPDLSSSASSSQQTPSWYWEPCDSSEAAAYVDLSTPVRRRKKRVRRTSFNIADKYIQGQDGRWRKADSWELYGSASCPTSDCMSSPPTDFPVQDDQVSASTGTVTVTSTSSNAPNLPSGWGKDEADNMAGIILGLSLSLAVALLIFMLAVVRWRRKRHSRLDEDAEKTSPVADGASVHESEEVIRARTQQRLWARASAKWVANVRQSARRRRKRMAAAKDSEGRALREAQASSSAVSLAHSLNPADIDRRLSSESRAPSFRRSRRPQTPSRSPSPASYDRHGEPYSLNHPPAYLSGSSSSVFQHIYSRGHSHPLDVAPDSHGIPQFEPPPLSSADRSPPPPLSPLPYEPPVHSAHVAVDDKAVLARMAHLASAPPPTVDGPLHPEVTGGSSEVHPSVPVLDDGPFEEIPPDIQFDGADSGNVRGNAPDRRLGLPSRAHDAFPAPPHGPASSSLDPELLCSVPLHAVDELGAIDGADGEVPSYAEDVRRHRPTLMLPPPPAKVAMAGPMFYEYPDEFERDVATAEPESGPSAPPFGEPSHPPFEFDCLDAGAGPVPDPHSHMMEPSAPPLAYADDAPLDAGGLLPSAPPLDLELTAAGEDVDFPACSHSGSRPHSRPSSPARTAHGEGPPQEDCGGVSGGGVACSAPLSSSPDDQGSATAPATASGGPDAGSRELSHPAHEHAHAYERNYHEHELQHPDESEAAPPRYLP
ncbi:hypothetical protein BD413DRAFT_490010 [Trametes elegans]|nr:hypothetical protein BD413DRAFT_490010 [Trametes elegans]